MCHQQRLRPACAYAQSDQSLCSSFEYSLTVKLPTEHHLEFLSIKGGCIGSSECTHVKLPHCWKSHVTAKMQFHSNCCWPRIKLSCIKHNKFTLPDLSYELFLPGVLLKHLHYLSTLPTFLSLSVMSMTIHSEGDLNCKEIINYPCLPYHLL